MRLVKPVAKPHYLEASLIEKENALDELLSSLLLQRERERGGKRGRRNKQKRTKKAKN
jgi:hypothetical protein